MYLASQEINSDQTEETSALFFWSFLILVYFILVNVFLSIVVDAYVHVKNSAQQFTILLAHAHLVRR